MSKHKVLSYSAISQFEHCPLQYKVVKLDKLYPYEQSEEAKWGDYVHKCLEDAIMRGVPLPNNVSQYQPLVTAVETRRANGWEVDCERTFAIHNDYTAEFTTAKDAWWSPRNALAGKIDVLMLSPDKDEVVIVDWKTNKSAKYADPKQIDLYALCVMLAIPTVTKVTGCLMFVCDDYKMVRSTYTRADIDRLKEEWRWKVNRVVLAIVNDNFPAGEATPLCGWCPHSECDNWQQGQDYLARRKKRR